MNLPTDDVKTSAPKKQAKKTSTKSKAKKAEPKSVVKSETPVLNIELQYAGKAIPYTEIVEKAKIASRSIKDLNIYIKPEENRVYYVADGKVGSFEI